MVRFSSAHDDATPIKVKAAALQGAACLRVQVYPSGAEQELIPLHVVRRGDPAELIPFAAGLWTTGAADVVDGKDVAIMLGGLFALEGGEVIGEFLGVDDSARMTVETTHFREKKEGAERDGKSLLRA